MYHIYIHIQQEKDSKVHRPFVAVCTKQQIGSHSMCDKETKPGIGRRAGETERKRWLMPATLAASATAVVTCSLPAELLLLRRFHANFAITCTVTQTLCSREKKQVAPTGHTREQTTTSQRFPDGRGGHPAPSAPLSRPERNGQPIDL